MASPTEVLKAILDKHPSAPFLFVGSGFSRRYLGLEDWVGLLARFCGPIRDFGYYNSKANGDLPAAASNMAIDYNEWWWSADETAESRANSSKFIKGQADALKLEISRYVGNFSLEDARKSHYGNEIAQLSEVAVDGIITTNWDTLLEELFPGYKVFIGQEELLFSNPQSIGEIYKIHGSVTDPSSLVLTTEDYAEFSFKNPYLAAKLVTIFVEHPIIFLGYSIADPHIRNIITSIAQCLSQEKIAAFQENLIFVQRMKDGGTPAIEKTTIQSGDFSVTMMVATLADFEDVFSALAGYKRKIPARVLRFFKEQLYELIHAPVDNEKKLAVVDLEDIGSADDIEFVVGAGVAKRHEQMAEMVAQAAESALAKKGYAGVTPNEVFADCLLDKSEFDGAGILSAAYPAYARSSRTFIPIFRYLRAAGIESDDALAASKYEGAKKIVGKMRGADYTSNSYATRYKRSFEGLSTKEIIEKSSSPIEALLMLAFQPANTIDIGTLRDFLRDNAGTFDSEPYLTAYRKLVCRYDRLAFGF
jgi:hypothetical protein